VADRVFPGWLHERVLEQRSMIRRHVTNCDRLTGKPEVIPETESLHYLQESQGRSRKRTLSTRSRNFPIGVRKVCATGPHETMPNCTNLVAASNASRRNCWRLRSCKSVASHSKSADLRVLGVRLPLPAPRSKNRRADAPKTGFHVSRLLEPASHIRELG